MKSLDHFGRWMIIFAALFAAAYASSFDGSSRAAKRDQENNSKAGDIESGYIEVDGGRIFYEAVDYRSTKCGCERKGKSVVDGVSSEFGHSLAACALAERAGAWKIVTDKSAYASGGRRVGHSRCARAYRGDRGWDYRCKAGCACKQRALAASRSARGVQQSGAGLFTRNSFMITVCFLL